MIKQGRVVLEYNKFYNVLIETDSVQCELLGKYKHSVSTQSELPKVGDWVNVDLSEKDSPIITSILPRKNEFLRKSKGHSLETDIIATNIDVAFIVMGLTSDFNLHRLERYLVLIEGFNIQPVLVFNKLDLCTNLEKRYAELAHILMHYPSVYMSCKTNEGIEELKSFLKPDHTYVFIGSSGVGKSSIINILLDEDLQKIGAEQNEGQGKHTTRHRELFVLASKSIIIDTPGIREVQLWETEESLRFSFLDINQYSDHCKFSNCSHSHEIGCAVKKAVEDGLLPERRHLHYCKLLDEVKALQLKKNRNKKFLNQSKTNKKK